MTTSRAAAEHLVRLRARNPLIHNITNYVAMDVSANVLLALGASPAMIHAPEEVEDFVALADALVINVGTLSTPWIEAMHRAADRARALEKPIVLDPVGAGATRFRTNVACELLRGGITAVRGNASEILALGAAAGGLAPDEKASASGADAAPEPSTRGVDTSHDVSDATRAAQALAAAHGCVVAVTGPVDAITGGSGVLQVPGGSPLMAKVTALGCSATATMAAFLASRDASVTPLESCAHALALFKLAGARAASGAAGPGSFRVAFIDALAQIGPDEVTGEAAFAT